MIPTPGQCYRLMDEYGMLANIREHSILVARISVYLAAGLRAVGLDIPHPLVLAAALLHDIAKTPCLASKKDHAREGRRICLAHGFAELADAVGEHVVLAQPFSPLVLTATEVVYYADKRVNHDQVVGLEERLEYIMDRYGQNDPLIHEKIRDNFARCQLEEEKIYRFLSTRTEELAALLAREPQPFPGGEEPEERLIA